MIKYILLSVVMVLLYCGTMAGLLFFTGNLDPDKLRNAFGAGDVGLEEVQPEAVEDNIDSIARQQQAREEALRRREETLNEREQRLELARQDLREMQTNIENLLQQFNESLDELDADREQRLQAVADSIGSMEEEEAAKTLENLDEDVQVAVLSLISDRARGEILSNMEPQNAARLLTRFQQPDY